MKKPVCDLRKFRFSKLNDPEFSHLKWLAGWIFYFTMYFVTENLIPYERCRPVHCALDDVIPFCEYFAIPYIFWYFLVFGSLLYFGMYKPKSFIDLQKYIIVTQVVAMTIYVLFPNRQDLRPTEFVNNNIFTQALGFLYSFDTCTGVCPSLHVAYSFGLVSIWTKEKDVSGLWKGFIVFCAIIISMATAFVKQHSTVDIFAALPVCLLAEAIVYGKRYQGKRMRTAEKRRA